MQISDPKTMAGSGLAESWVELAMLYLLTVVGSAFAFDLHWLIAMAVSPLIMLAMLAVVLLAVQVLWMLVVGIDRLGNAIGIRKSPLA